MSSAGLVDPAGVTRAIAAGVPSSVTPANPFGVIEQYANAQNALNKNLEFQREYAAKQQAGEIIASSPDLPTAIKRMQQNPGVAGYIPQIINSYQTLEQLTAQTAGTQQANSQSAFVQLLKFVPSAMTDLSSWDTVMKTALQTVPGQLRGQIEPMIPGLKAALLDDLPKDKDAAVAAYARRWNALELGAGYNPAQIAQQTGEAENIATPQGQIPVVRQPGVLGGAVTPAAGVIANLPAPQFLGSPSGGFVQAGGMQGATGGVGGSNALVRQESGGGVAPITPVGAAGGNALVPSTSQPQPLRSIVDTPVEKLTPAAWNAGAAAAAKLPPVRRGVTGIPVMSQVDTEQANSMAHDFATKGTNEFNQAQQGLFYLQQMDNDLDSMAKNGGLLTPGFQNNARLKIATGLNTLAQAFGGKPLIDPAKVAAGESSNKITATLAAGLVNSFFGSQHVAYGTLERGIESVPGIENSYLGGKLLTEGLRAVAKRAIAQHVFQQAWQQQRGTLAGSDLAFNAQFPPSQLADQVLGKYGLTENGFESPAAVGRAVQQGFLTPENGRKILLTQFGKKGGGGGK